MVSEQLARTAKVLDELGLDYMILGGQAVLAYGVARLTDDIDVTIGADVDQFDHVLSALQRLGFEVLVEDAQSFVKRTMVLPVRDSESGIRIDMIFSHSDYERVALSRTRKIQVGQTMVNFASPEDLIVHKIVAGRPRDIEDVKGVLIKNPDVDREYIERWLAQFENSLDRNFLSVFRQLLQSL